MCYCGQHILLNNYKITIKILCERMEESLTHKESVGFPGQEVKVFRKAVGVLILEMLSSFLSDGLSLRQECLPKLDQLQTKVG